MHFSDKNKPQFTKKAHQNKLPKNKIEIENNSGKISTKTPGIQPPKNYLNNAGIQQQGSKQIGACKVFPNYKPLGRTKTPKLIQT